MKRLQKLSYIVMGSALTLAVMGTALAVTTALTITVDPTVKIQVNGAEFHPKDANGKDVMTFAYEGTTYAPVRAMAAAFGLEVGYDKVTRMATVRETAAPETTPETDTALPTDYSTWTAEEEAAYQEFKGMWEVVYGIEGNLPYANNSLRQDSVSRFKNYVDAHDTDYIQKAFIRHASEIYDKNVVGEWAGAMMHVQYKYYQAVLASGDCWGSAQNINGEKSRGSFSFVKSEILQIIL